jgi:branched-chain amino acid transport system permease protein
LHLESEIRIITHHLSDKHATQTPMTIHPQVVNAIGLGAVYSLFALGYALVFSVLGVLNLAHSAVFMWGAYIGLITVTDLGLPIWLALPAAMLVSGFISVALELVAFAPLRRRNAARISQLISSIGAAIFLVSLAQLLFGTQPQNFPRDLIPTEAFPDLPIAPLQALIFVTALALMVLLQYLVQYTRLGQAMRAVAFNERTASLLGVDVNFIYRFTFFLAGALAGAAGVLFGMAFGSMTPFIGEKVALKGLTVIVLGGLGNIPGAVVGGFVVAGLEVFSVAQGGSDWRDAIVFTLLFLILLVRPQGLVGRKEITKA